MISIIIPVYNGEKYLDRCLMTCINQTYKDIEIIIIDDASTDHTKDIIEGYVNKYPDKIRAIYQSENHKQGAARNRGIKAARGEFIIFVDSDDYIADDMCEKYIETQNESDSDIVISDVWVVNGKEHSISTMLPNVELLGLDTKMATYFMDCSPCSKLIRKSVVIDSEVLFPENIFFEDSATVPLWLMHCRKIKKIEDGLYYYVQNQNSTCHSGDLDRDMDAIKSLDYFWHNIKLNNLDRKYKLQLTVFSVMRVMDTVGRLKTKHGGGNEKCFMQLKDALHRYAYDFENNQYVKLCYSKNQIQFIRTIYYGTFEEYISFNLINDTEEYLNNNSERIKNIITALVRNTGRNIIVWGLGKNGKCLYDIAKQLKICKVYPVDMSENIPSYIMKYNQVQDEDAMILTMNRTVYDYVRKLNDDRIVVNIMDCLRYGIF